VRKSTIEAGSKKRSWKSKLAIGALAVGVLVAVPTAAHAEGSYTSFVNQAQPGFLSRTWGDGNLDGAATKITLTDCKANKAGKTPGTTAITSVSVALYRGTSLLTIKKQKCGTYDFGRQSSGTYRFKITAVNGITDGDRSIFLNVDKVTVSY